MAIVKNNYVKRGIREKANAKATIRYIQNRRGVDNTKTSRSLFGWDGVMGRYEAYRMIDEAEKGSVFYRIIISPDPETEDTKRDLHLRNVTENMMHALEDHIHQQVSWVGAIHADHAPHRHVHIVAIVPGRLERQEFQALPRVLRSAATQAALEQRQELDRATEHQTPKREEAAWEQGY